MGNFSKPRQQTTFVQQTKGLTSKKIALYVHYNYSWHNVLPSSEKLKNAKWRNSAYLRKREPRPLIFRIFVWNWYRLSALFRSHNRTQFSVLWFAIMDYSLTIGAPRTAVHENHFANPFSDFQYEHKIGKSIKSKFGFPKWNPPRRKISVRQNPFSDFMFYLEIWNSKSGFYNRKHPKFFFNFFSIIKPLIDIQSIHGKSGKT